MRELAARKGVLVVGAGRTGQAVVRFFQSSSTPVWLTDRDPSRLAPWSSEDGLRTVPEAEAVEVVPSVDFIVPSPGVPRNHPVLEAATKLCIPVWSEMELASRFFPKPVLAVTGTNGKSTTTTLLGAMLRASGVRTFVGGNLGTPFLSACSEPWDAAVVEVSSFQLEWVETFRPRVGVFLNLTPDHLDRYPNLDEYGRTKLRLFARQAPDDWGVFHRDDPWVAEAFAHAASGAQITFGWEEADCGAWVEGEQVWVRRAPHADPVRLSLSRTRLAGKHNVENIMAAALAALLFGVPQVAVQRAIDEAKPLPHRVEFVREWAGILFYDDSKGTNIGATAKAVASFDRPVVLLAGGYDKGSRFDLIAPVLQRHVRVAVFFGASAPKWVEQVGKLIPHEVAPTLREAVPVAARLARPGDVVLLSPGCASFDEFDDYAHRGRSFRAWVEAL